ncbi:MAG TPA: carboxypeptidase-like regulatory domain-containing protein [Candidatus Hydrogenedentes bacterium]|nr:carboxypeptidase-like regulatory domain-containing protein [Candidatus Hydrogenedentota bacterium]HPG65229.1 carboxypeptidase-like regulatory domain-containing protein [Candidatus Hydrogenedentota bacterium]
MLDPGHKARGGGDWRLVGLLAAALLALAGFLLLWPDQERPTPAIRRSETSGTVARRRADPTDHGFGRPSEYVSLASDGNPAAATGGVFVSGRVVNVDGEPVPEARISFREDTWLDTLVGAVARRPVEGSIREISADEDGRFSLDVSECAGSMALFRISATGHREAEFGGIRIPLEGIDGLKFVLHRLAAISGRVVNLDGEPVAGVAVLAEGSRYRSVAPDTGKEGTFTFVNLDGGEYRLQGVPRYVGEPPTMQADLSHGQALSSWNVHQLGFENQAIPTVTVLVEPEEHLEGVEIVVPAQADARLEGIVLDEAGMPIEGAEAWIGPEGETERFGVCTRPTGADGRFKIETIIRDDRPEGQLRLFCVCKGYEQAVLRDFSLGSFVTVTLQRLTDTRGAIEGYVKSRESHKPVTKARVMLASVLGDDGTLLDDTWERNRAIATGETDNVDENGHFSLPSVPVGDATLVVATKDYGVHFETGIRVNPDAVTTVTILLNEPGTLSVHVRISGGITKEMLGGRGVLIEPSTSAGTASTRGIPYGSVLGLQEIEELENGRVHRLRVMPDTYDVTLSEEIWFPEQKARGWHVERRAQAVVASGGETNVEFEIGVAGRIEGRAPPRENEDLVLVILVPEVDSAASTQDGCLDGWTPAEGMRNLSAVYGDFSSAHTTGGLYEKHMVSSAIGRFFICGVPDGDYRAETYGHDHEKDRWSFRGTTTFTIEDGYANIELPE